MPRRHRRKPLTIPAGFYWGNVRGYGAHGHMTPENRTPDNLLFNLLVNKHIETDDFMQFYPLLIHLASSPAERSPNPWGIARGNARGVREVPARPHAVRARTFCSDAPEA